MVEMQQHCMSKTTGKKERGHVTKCLKKLESEGKVSPECKGWLDQRRQANPCMDDIEKFCAGARRAGKECLQKHIDEISPGCKEILNAKKDGIAACQGDREKHCSGLEGKELRGCMKKMATDGKASSACMEFQKKMMDLQKRMRRR